MTTSARRHYDVGAQLCADPLVTVVDDFVIDTERRHIIEVAGRHMGEARVSQLGENAPSSRRTGSVAWIAHDHTTIVHGLVRRIADVVRLPIGHAESLQVVHYAETQEYQPHYDAWDVDTDKGREKTERGGQRVVTALVYLNDVAAGGGTSFPRLDLQIEAVAGRMVVFHDLVPNGRDRHPDSLHGGMPVLSGEKWACNLWFREQPYQHAPGASLNR